MMKINEHTIHAIQRGPKNGPVVIFLHHGLGASRAWSKQVDPLVAAGWRVILYDRWGYGKSASRQTLSMPFFEDDQHDLEVLMDQLEIDRTVLVGHSDGGTIAMYFAASRPQRVECLVSVAAHIYIEPKMLPGILGIRQGFENDPDFRQRFQRTHGEKYQDLFYSWIHGWLKPEHLGWDMRPQLAKITCRTLIVQGLEDEHATPQHARDTAAAIPGAGLWLVPGVGHMLPQDAPQVFNSRLLEFIARGTISGENPMAASYLLK